MLDIETLSTNDDAAVIAIGAVAFDDRSVVETGYWPLTMKGLTGHIDPQTLAWWMEQTQEAQRAAFTGNRVTPAKAAIELCDMAQRTGANIVWANGPHFDITILKQWWRRYREDGKIMAPIGVELQPLIPQPWPFKYNAVRDYRTIVDFAKSQGFTDAMYDAAKGVYVAHNALEDACAQVRVVIACEQYLKRGLEIAGEKIATGGSWETSPPVGSLDWRTSKL